MRAICRHLKEFAFHPHLTDREFRMSIMKAMESPERGNRESFDQAFVRFATEAIYRYEREHFCK